MTLTIRAGQPSEPEATALLTASHSLMNSLFPSDGCHYLSIDALCAENVRFFLAELDGAAVGCAALMICPGYGEVKSMFVEDAARGQGVAEALLRHLTDLATKLGLPLMRLETGDGLDAAHRLYFRHGFAVRGPFGTYKEHPASVFMEKRLG